MVFQKKKNNIFSYDFLKTIIFRRISGRGNTFLAPLTLFKNRKIILSLFFLSLSLSLSLLHCAPVYSSARLFNNNTRYEKNPLIARYFRTNFAKTVVVVIKRRRRKILFYVIRTKILVFSFWKRIKYDERKSPRARSHCSSCCAGRRLGPSFV